ncbi:hypothetical protein SH449x_004420 [Pirellulaceae bacterium SH449]
MSQLIMSQLIGHYSIAHLGSTVSNSSAATVSRVFALKLVTVAFALVLLVSVTEAWASPPAWQIDEPAEASKLLEQLAKELDSNRLAERDQAEAKMIALGPSYLPFFPAISDDQSPELSMRLERIRAKMDEQETLLTQKPSVVNLVGAFKGLDALQKLASQTGNLIDTGDSEHLQQTISVEFKETPFWKSLDEILDQLGLTIPHYDGMKIEVIESRPESPLRISSAVYSGAFRLEPIRVTKNSELVLPSRSSLTISLLISWEPRLSPSEIQLAPESLAFLCENGERLECVEREPISIIPSGGNQAVVELEFRMPSNRADSVMTWSGELDITYPGRLAAVAFSDLETAQGKSLETGMMTVTVDSIRKNRSVREISLSVAVGSRDGSDTAWDSLATMQEALLYAPDGAQIENVGWSSDPLGNGKQGFSYLFELPDQIQGYRLVFRAPATVGKERLPFTGGEIKLP